MYGDDGQYGVNGINSLNASVSTRNLRRLHQSGKGIIKCDFAKPSMRHWELKA